MATIPEKPQTNLEQYLNRIATGDGEYPAKPRTNVEQYLNYIIENGIGGGGEAKVVDELPEEGETGYIYLVLKESTKTGDIYDEYIWALQQDGETYDWEHLGATNEVSIKLYDTEGNNTDGAMTQRAVTDALDEKADNSDIPTIVQTTGTSTADVMSQNAVTSIVGRTRELTTDDYNYPTNNPNKIAIWLLPTGIYYWKTQSLGPNVITSTNYNSFGSTCGTLIITQREENNNTRVCIYAFFDDGNYLWQGRTLASTGAVIQEHIRVLTTDSVVNHLTATSATSPLSANQGRVLNNKIGGDLSNLTTTDKTSLINAINEVAAQGGAASLTNAEFNQIFGTSLEEES